MHFYNILNLDINTINYLCNRYMFNDSIKYSPQIGRYYNIHKKFS